MVATSHASGMTLLFFSGSPRPASAVSYLLRAAAAVPTDAHVVLYEGLLTLPLFAPDLDGPPAVMPPAVAALRQHLVTASLPAKMGGSQSKS